MTQDELTLVLEALKWCHGGEPCGTSEAIAVVEKALANVATNDTSKEYVDETQKQRHEQEPVAFEWDEDTDPIGEVVGFIEGSNYIMVKVYDGKQVSLNDDLYETPPQRTWVGLTNNDLQPIAEEYRILFGSWVHDFARAIEAKLKEKNT